MCGISGFLHIAGNGKSYRLYMDYFMAVNDAIAQRGPDCFGVWGLKHTLGSEKKIITETMKENNLKYNPWKGILTKFSDRLPNPHLVLCNFRGIPTTEYLSEGAHKSETVQPYFGYDNRYAVVHNGQLSNDQDIWAERNYPPQMSNAYETIPGFVTKVRPDIDSYLFLHLMNELGAPTTQRRSFEFAKQLHKVEGSFAMAGVDTKNQVLYLARNFRGLYLSMWKDANDTYLTWSSESKALELPFKYDPTVELSLRELPMDRSLAIYYAPSMLQHILLDFPSIHRLLTSFVGGSVSLESKDVDTEKKLRSQHNAESAAVVLSGGLDSTVCATMACKSYKNVHLLHFQYGARAEDAEGMAVQAITSRLEAKFPDCKIYLKIIPLDFIKKLGGSTLTEHDTELAQGEAGVETDHEWVPARNTAMIGLAASYCDRYDIGAIILGLNMEEGSVYKDNSIEYYQQMEKALQLGTRSKPAMVMPLGNSMKHHIVKRGIEIEAPLDVSWSCYEGGDMRCGQCGPCTMRQRAYAINGLIDPVRYIKCDEASARILEQRNGSSDGDSSLGTTSVAEGVSEVTP